ncbi:MAG: primosomal protein N' [Bacteroidetes bacterium GWF2_42_66]|nr:MAG: primosomal protein N' [Bacteroidetes bacterium GWA2_42_15]OFY00271.1 MAG: primosomal protein N' [Bacteroidetes bacterium GWE2_42_39]OFY47158.1 MAG: primosomal protein N' [Bacteroidetes bacterium GWF2_42_66]HBL76655.1 primosomal protein N' [Prolixibacteraceae bacterium]HCU62964.1 primosomal protein N' [Prolixibacteraceae bacterium]
MVSEIYADVILPLPLNQKFTYRVPLAFQPKMKTGIRVIVQFGQRKFLSALVHRIHDQRPTGDYEIKDIEAILDEEPVVDRRQIEVWEWMAEYYCCSLGEVFKAALPSGLKLESQTKIRLNEEADFATEFSENENSLLMLLQSREQVSIQEVNQFLGRKNSFSIIKLLLEKNAVVVEEQMKESYKPKLLSFVRLNEKIRGEEQIKTCLESLGRAKKQEHLFQFFLSETIFSPEIKREIGKKELLEGCGASDAVLRGLQEKEILEVFQKETGRLDNETSELLNIYDLSEPQQKAFDEIKTHFEEQQTVLLHGVTSSGKTEIYIKLIEEQLNRGNQVLYLVPEIGLTAQMVNRLKKAFGSKTGIYHSKFNDAERVEIWFSVLNEKPGKNGEQYQLVLGARSAALLPFRKLGLVIVDEEHENSYKQYDPAPRYNARDLAVVLGNIHGAKVLLGTATPSIESYFNAKSKKYGLVQLTERFSGIELPEIIIADTKDAYKRKRMRSFFTPELFDEITQALENKEQVILFQNRRGFAPFIQCAGCGWIPKCKHCDVSLTYHKSRSALLCHYCGYTQPVPSKCPDCGSEDVRTKGFGTEKIEEEISSFFPDAKIARMDLDTTRAKNAYQQIIQRLESGNVDILVGTQMVTKGLDFENVRVVGILNADNLLNYPDFRSYERSFQLIAQVSGRAGRKNKRGKVVVQTSQPDHPVIVDAKENNFERMFATQLHERKLFKYPPYYRLVKVVVKHKNQQRLDLVAGILASEFRKLFNFNVLGPEYPVVGRIQLWYQKEILIKLSRDGKMLTAKERISEIIEKVKSQPNNSGAIIYADVDPM